MVKTNPVARLEIMKRFLRISLKASLRYPVLFGAIFFFILLGQITNLFIPLLLQRLVDALTKISVDVYSAGAFVTIFVLPIVLARLLSSLFIRVSGFLASELQPRVIRNLLDESFSAVLEKSYRFFSDHFTGSLVRRIQSLGTSYRDLIDTVWSSILPMSVTIVGSLIFLGRRNIFFAEVLFVWGVLIFIVQILITKRKLPFDAARASKHAQVTGSISDAITNANNISLFTAVAEEKAYVGKQLEEWRKLQTHAWHIAESGAALQHVLNALGEVALMSFVIVQWKKGFMTVGDIVFVQSMLLIVFASMFELGRVMRRLYEAGADTYEMLDIIDDIPEIRDRRGAKPLAMKRAEVNFQHVTFAYHDRVILRDFSLRIAPKEKVALVGPSGSGKTTVTKLLFRFFDLQKGSIMIDGQDIAKVTQDSLRQTIAYVPQEPILFHRSLRDNIRYGRRDATDAEVEEAAKKARCHDFITSFPEGYETLVGERGVKLSGGERQRVAIARAILKNAPILVLDEATSSLDSESESLIQEALRSLMKDKTVIVIAHRLSTIMDMDRILVMQSGQVIDEGSHDALRTKVGVYQKLWNIQAGGFQHA